MYPRRIIAIDLDSLPQRDSATSISRWMVLHIPVFIIAAGGLKGIQRKISRTRFPYNGLSIVRGKSGKIKALRKLLEKFEMPIIFIDDDQTVLDSVRENGIQEDEVMTVLLRGIQRSCEDRLSEHRHIEISHLDEIDTVVMGEKSAAVSR